MGTLIYGPAATSIAIDDRDLAHLQTVILAKLRRSESFAFSWERPGDVVSGHTTLWMHPQMYLEFSYSGAKGLTLNRAWIDRLMTRANSGSGLELIPEEAPAS
ncbi:DUF7882 family protein [Subtercola lobariae]|uniref:DUF7882 domain-containing protein n=1 Tax=Subtercola lobariae TaxID=1588641 RepID=A0A917B214_9MICO|nr:ATP-dependent DNA ligase [Subtercola lobariae]GGF16094.1 hypothetical protein GCM10011399_07400 [Subtercola lobariae]